MIGGFNLESTPLFTDFPGLPALIPEMSYAGMEISDGGMAMEGYFRMCQAGDPAEVEKVRQALLEYCKTVGYKIITHCSQ